MTSLQESGKNSFSKRNRKIACDKSYHFVIPCYLIRINPLALNLRNEIVPLLFHNPE